MPPGDERLPHGYTNLTRRLDGGGIVEKVFVGSDAGIRLQREVLCLTLVAEVLPVPRVLFKDELRGLLHLGWIEGTPGQDLIEQGLARSVLHATGSLLSILQAEGSALLLPHLAGIGTVAVHGDFGPQNLLFDGRGVRVLGLVDWEFAHRGSPQDDLAWAEWIVRMHHAEAVEALAALFAGYGSYRPWSERHAAMVRQCEQLMRRCETEGSVDAVGMWQARLQATEAWVE